jgi:uncharacterized protein
MTTTPLESVNKALLRQMAAQIREEIPVAEVRLFGSHARGWPGLIQTSTC